MTTPRHVQVRSARDRIIDLLGFGETYPLQDVAVQGEQLTVSFSQRTTFAIEPGQEDVRYELYDGDNAVEPEICHVVGNGAETVLPGPIVTGDKTFRIHAVKLAPPGRDDFLLQQASVKVGLNTRLRAYVDLPRLNPNLPNLTDTDPRIADHRSIVLVRVEGTQAEASYQLVYPGPGGVAVATDPVPSSGGDLSLLTGPVEEDTIVRIRATRMSGPPDTALLAAVLPLAVRANPSLAVSIDGSPLVDPAAAVAITIAGSQASVVYSAYARALGDRDFVVDDLSPANILAVPVPASLDVPEHEVRVRRPVRPTPSQPEFAQLSGPTQGNGADQKLPFSAPSEDCVVVIHAHKDHFATGGPGTPTVGPGASDLQLEQAVVALARPEAASGLTLAVSPDADGHGGAMRVSGGQRGVFYHVRADASGQELGLPAYFHRRDEQDPQQNRGIEQLEIERDLAIARAPDSTQPQPSPELTPPLDPIVDVEPLPGAQVSVMAVKARTRVGWLASRPFPVTTKP